MKSELRPKTASPATPSPITVPPVKATLSASFKLVRAACVVRTFALVAMFIPKYPAVALNTAPIRNEMAITGEDVSTNVPDHPRTIAATIAK